MLVTTPSYRASRDKLHFNRRQTRAQQQVALANLPTYKLRQLPSAIQYDGERIPGRTARESLAMVDHVIALCHRVEADLRREANRRANRSLLIAFGMAALLVLLMFMPLLLNELALSLVD